MKMKDEAKKGKLAWEGSAALLCSLIYWIFILAIRPQRIITRETVIQEILYGIILAFGIGFGISSIRASDSNAIIDKVAGILSLTLLSYFVTGILSCLPILFFNVYISHSIFRCLWIAVIICILGLGINSFYKIYSRRIRRIS